MLAKTSRIAAAAKTAIGAQDTIEKRARPTVRPPLPEAHVDVAMIDINDFAALARMSVSWLHDEVRTNRGAPQPLRFGPRCTRYRLSDVRAYLIERAAKGASDTATAALLRARAIKASTKAKEARDRTRAERSAAAAVATEQ